MVCCQNASHPAGNMPSMICLPLGFSDGIRPIFQSGSKLCSRLLAHLDSHVLVGMIYSDTRDGTVMDNNNLSSTLGLLIYPLLPRIQGPA